MCENLSISELYTAGIPDNVMKTLILDIKFNENYEQIDDVYVDYHGAAMQAVKDKGKVTQ